MERIKKVVDWIRRTPEGRYLARKAAEIVLELLANESDDEDDS